MTGEPDTLCAAFQRTAAVAPDAVALRTVGDTQTVTWRDYADQVREVAAGFAGLGVRRGDTVALMMANRIEFYPVDVGALHAGATSFSIYNTLAPSAIRHVLGNAGADVVVCEAQYVERIQDSEVPLSAIVVVDAEPGEQPAGTITLADLKNRAAPDFDFDATWRAVRAGDVATLIYTSGTTGNPKGVESTHEALMFETRAVAQVQPVEFGDRITSFLPSAHIADRLTALYLHLVHGTQITVVADARRIAAAIPDCLPTIWGAVSRVWEKLKAAVELAVDHEPDEQRRRTLQWALEVGRRRFDTLRSGAPVPPELAAEHEKAEEVLALLRARLGFAELKWAMSGAAPISPETLAFFGALGLKISEAWGMSEVTCIASMAPADPLKVGTVGTVVPGMEMKVAADGELLLRGPLVMKRYRGEPAKTADAISPDGWLYTGDVVTVDEDGYITVIDRKKELIISATGKNMSPANIENALAAGSPLIGAVAAIGDGRPYNTALIVLDPDATTNVVGTLGAEPSRHPDVVSLVSAAVAAGNANLARVEQVKRFRIVTEFWEPGGDELTLTMKLRRKPIAEKYAAGIEALYADPMPDDVHEPAGLAEAVRN
ncbi:fatty acid--CoA ligase FadD11 [Saccharopolyspora gloriosae]|uniref:fatty acid--CoA ligase FadD11 n=1 Tax=Saccharopolyspora gloriosae TaxID=455344 RepID=UPI001FB72C60|nr:fatty acid--CoA ligase FadD11 [Saccharopolyspora gloriosae]